MFEGNSEFIEAIKPHVIYGDFTLACGRQSKTLIDLAKFLRSGKAKAIVKSAVRELDYPCWDSIGGPLSAADLICPAITVQGWFGVRKEAKGRGTDNGRITGNFIPNSRVLMVEDVCTTGGSLIRAADEVIAAGGRIVGAIVLVSRDAYGGTKTFHDKFGVPVYSVCRYYEDFDAVV